MKNKQIKQIAENWNNLPERTKEIVLDLVMEERKNKGRFT